MTQLKQQLQSILSRITEAERQYGREPGSVKLIAVSKTWPAPYVREAFNGGQTRFGESYVQEAKEKIAALADASIEWHFIGAIQGNKTRFIAEHFSWVHSIDRAKIAQRLNDQRPSHLPPLNICLQINISNEDTKAGTSLAELHHLAEKVATLDNITLRGLMVLPSQSTSLTKQKNDFAQVRSAWDALRTQGYSLDTLSMGMSNDFEVAISEGATFLRIGTAIFGQRAKIRHDNGN